MVVVLKERCRRGVTMLYRDAEIRKCKQYKLAKEGKAIWHIHKNGDVVAFCGLYDFWVPRVAQKDGAKGTCKRCS